MEERVSLGMNSTTENHMIGLHIADVKRIVRQKANEIYPIPRTSQEVLGLMDENGTTIPVFDLSVLIASSTYRLKPIARSLDIIAVIVTSLQGYQVGLAIPSDPDFYLLKEEQDEEGDGIYSGSFLVDKSNHIVHILDPSNLFPNLEIIGSSNVSESDHEEGLDLSQYVLTE